MKKALFLFLICSSSLCTFAATGSQYVIDDQKVEQLFTNSVDASMSMLSNKNSLLTASGQFNFSGAARMGSNDKSLALALVLDFFLGGLGIHRLYLGTATMTWVGYILSCGGIFGIVPFVDFIVLIVHNDDISQYIDNTRYFMWG
jgi:TM2 domain-containing membrane protein YozV